MAIEGVCVYNVDATVKVTTPDGTDIPIKTKEGRLQRWELHSICREINSSIPFIGIKHRGRTTYFIYKTNRSYSWNNNVGSPLWYFSSAKEIKRELEKLGV